MQHTYKTAEVPELANEKCAVIYALELIGGKWRLPVIWKLSRKESMRYNAQFGRHYQYYADSNAAGFGTAWAGCAQRISPNTAPCRICADRAGQRIDSGIGNYGRMGPKTNETGGAKYCGRKGFSKRKVKG